MDAYEATRVVLSRIQSLDPENAHRIMGLLLLQEHGEQEMIRLAFAPETLLQSVVLKTLKELGLAPPSIPVTHSGDASPLLLRQNSTSRLLAASSPSSWAPPPVFSRSKSGMSSNGLSPSLDEHQRSDELVSPNILGISPFYGGADLIDDFQLPDRLSFLGDNGTAPNSNHALSVAANVSRSSDAFNLDICRSPSGNVDGAMLPNKIGWGINGYHHCRSSSAAELCLGDPAAGYGWKPCLYFARGYCKNGSACRFLHGLPEDGVAAKMDAAAEQQFEEFLQRSKSQRIGDVSQLMASAFPFSPTGSVPPSPSSSSSKCLNFWHQHQHQHPQNESQRVATAAAAALMLAGDDSHKFIGRSRMERNDLMTTPGSRQIYLTFPADSTFSEEDVSNYFSIYGPVQDVRIPFQQKRMFGFVTFVYPETVKLILAKGNPHFVCDSRVLVKPYKEKGKVPEKFRKQQQQQQQQAETLDLQQLAGARMMFNNGSFNQELLLRRKLEEQQQAAERQQAIELQAMRFTGLRLNLNNISFSSAPASINSPSLLATQPIGSVDSSNNGTNFCSSSSQEDSLNEEKSLSVAEIEEKSNGYDKNAAAGESNPKAGSDLQESSADHNLPDIPFASPTKSLFMLDSLSNYEDGTSVVNTSNNPDHLIASPLVPITSLPDKPSLGSCLLHMPRLSSGHGAIGM